MTKSDEDHEKDDDLNTDSQDNQDTDSSSQQSTDDTSPDSKKSQKKGDDQDWESSYKGLQKVVSSKNQQIKDLSDQVEKLTADFEGLKVDKVSKDKDVSDLEKTLKETQDQLNNLQNERDNLDKQLARHKVIMSDFPDLAPLAAYIPEGNDEAEFKDNAKAFAEAMEKYVDAGVKSKIKGSSVKHPTDSTEMASQKEIDDAYDKVVSLAGVLGKERDYEEAFQEWQKLKGTEQD